MQVIESILADAAQITALRRDIHAHPELCFEEKRTSDLIAEQLTSWGIPIHRGLGTTGIVAILKNGTSSRAVGAGDRLQPRGDVVEGFVPGHRREAAAALGADTLHRPQEAIVVIRALDVARDLGAERAVRRRVVGVAVDADRPAVVDGDEHRAGVGAVVWTGGADNGRDHLQTMA